MAPQSTYTEAAGTYSVILPGSLELDANDFSRICAVHPSDVGDGSYVVEFQFWQDAARYIKLAKKVKPEGYASLEADAGAEVLESPPGLSQPPAASGLLQAPPGLEPSNAATDPNKHVVEVSDLPKHLMSQKMLEATLEQAGLEKDITDIAFQSTDKVKITLSTHKAAVNCAKHFHGRKWNTTGFAITAKVLTNKSSIPKKSEAAKASPSSSSSLSKYAPAYVHSSLVERPIGVNWKRIGTSDASTTVSDEDAEEESWEADMKKLMAGSCVD